MVNLKKVKACPECGSENVIYDEDLDAIICQECGAEFEELEPGDEKKFEKASDVI